MRGKKYIKTKIFVMGLFLVIFCFSHKKHSHESDKNMQKEQTKGSGSNAMRRKV